jgi:transcriptional regulator with PAS, ATPase and Fis domain
MTQNRLNLLIGNSAAMADLRAEAERVARSDAKVLITGDSGVGKELVAHAIHIGSARADKPFIPVNCAGLTEPLLESELFGHVRGSFTGAYRDKPGKLELADSGTIFLDELGEMTLRMQALLLRFLESGELQKVGTDRATAPQVDVRVVAATNRNLREMVAQGSFRKDLYYRLNVIHLQVPPLRDRRDDIPLLVMHFLSRFTQSGAYVVRSISPEAMAVLTQHAWPGNVRELQNVIERLVVTGRSETIRPEDLPPDIRAHTIHVRPKKERRRTVADELYKRLTHERESFWSAVYPLYMQREITRGNVRDLVRMGLEEGRGNYKVVARLFNLQPSDYKRFLNFLRKHDCQLPFKEYRQ